MRDRATALVQACTDGRIATVLSLLKLGATTEKPTLSYNPITQSIVRSYSETEVPEPSLSAVYFWSIVNYDSDTKCFPTASRHLTDDEKSGLLELAAYVNDTSLILNLLLEHDFKPRQHTQIRTAAYWAALKNNDDTFSHLCQDDSDAVLTLWQLKNDNHIAAFEKYVTIVSATAKHKFETSPFDVMPRSTEIQSLAYSTACKSNKQDFKQICFASKTFLEVTEHSFSQSNFVALSFCAEALKASSIETQNCFHQVILDKFNYQQGSFWMIINDIHPYQSVMKMKLEEGKKFITKYGSAEGLLQYVVAQKFQDKPDAHEFFVLLEKKDKDVFKAILRYLMSRYNNPLLISLITRNKNLTLQESVSSIPNIQLEKDLTLNDVFRKFNLVILCDAKPSYTLPELTSVIWQKTAAMLDPKENDFRGLFAVSKKVYFDIKRLNKGKDLEHKVESIESSLLQVNFSLDERREKINEILQLIALIEKELEYQKKKGCCIAYSCHVLGALITILLFALNIRCDMHISDRRRIIQNKVIAERPDTFVLPCDDSHGAGGDICNPNALWRNKYTQTCRDLCADYNSLWWSAGFADLTTVALGLLVLGTTYSLFLPHDSDPSDLVVRDIKKIRNAIAESSVVEIATVDISAGKFLETAHQRITDEKKKIENILSESKMNRQLLPMYLSQLSLFNPNYRAKSLELQSELKEVKLDISLDALLGGLENENLKTRLLEYKDDEAETPRPSRCSKMCVIL